MFCFVFFAERIRPTTDSLRGLDRAPTHCGTLTERLRPPTPAELVGNAQAVESMQRWLRAWTTDRRSLGSGERMLLLHGPPGCGKTTAARALLASHGYAVTEINASSVSYPELRERFGMTVMANRGLLGKRERTGRRPRIAVLLDEIDGLCRRESDLDDADGGGGAFAWMWKIVDNPRRAAPVVCTCNDRYARRMRAICARATVVPFRSLETKDLLAIARRTSAALGSAVPTNRLLRLADRARGDARALVNDLEFESLAADGTGAGSGGRDRTPSDFDACDRALRNQTGARFSSSATGARFLWKNAPAAFDGTSCRAAANAAVLNRCQGMTAVLHDLSAADAAAHGADETAARTPRVSVRDVVSRAGETAAPSVRQRRASGARSVLSLVAPPLFTTRGTPASGNEVAPGAVGRFVEPAVATCAVRAKYICVSSPCCRSYCSGA